MSSLRIKKVAIDMVIAAINTGMFLKLMWSKSHCTVTGVQRIPVPSIGVVPPFSAEAPYHFGRRSPCSLERVAKRWIKELVHKHRNRVAEVFERMKHDNLSKHCRKETLNGHSR